MTHIENIPHILENGITHSSSSNANPDFVPIGDTSLITRRSEHSLNNGRRIGDYIPFYFGCRMPMLYVIQNGLNMVAPTPAENIVYCISSVQKIINEDLEFVFTDGHAVDSFSTEYTPAQIDEIENIIDRNAISARYWKDENDLDLKRRKEAELLVLGDINLTAILGYIVFNQLAKDRMIAFGVAPDEVYVKPDRYF